MNLDRITSRWKAFEASPRGRWVIKGARWCFLAGVLAFLAYQLSGIGWGEVWRSLPQTPWFYLIVLVMYFVLPVTESFIYGHLWKLRARDCLPVLLRKRVLNTDVLGYSGEFYLFAWARQWAQRDAGWIMRSIKDNLILSSAASLFTAALVVVGLVLAGQVRLAELTPLVEGSAPLYLGAAVAGLALLGVMLVTLRKAVFFLPGRTLTGLSLAHFGRFVLNNVLQVAQWWVVVPAAAFSSWATLLVMLVLINRIPLLPSRDLIFAGAGIGVSAMLDVPVAVVAGMLLVRSAIDRVLNLSLFALSSLWEEAQSPVERDSGGEASSTPPAGSAPDGPEAPTSPSKSARVSHTP